MRGICYSIREDDYDSFLFKNLGCLSEFMKTKFKDDISFCWGAGGGGWRRAGGRI